MLFLMMVLPVIADSGSYSDYLLLIDDYSWYYDGSVMN